MEKQKILIQQDNVDKKLIISNYLQLKLVKCSLYDAVGKLIFTKDKLGNASSYEFSTTNLSDGFYIVKLIPEDQTEIATKIIVKN